MSSRYPPSIVEQSVHRKQLGEKVWGGLKSTVDDKVTLAIQHDEILLCSIEIGPPTFTSVLRVPQQYVVTAVSAKVGRWYYKVFQRCGIHRMLVGLLPRQTRHLL